MGLQPGYFTSIPDDLGLVVADRFYQLAIGLPVSTAYQLAIGHY